MVTSLITRKYSFTFIFIAFSFYLGFDISQTTIFSFSKYLNVTFLGFIAQLKTFLTLNHHSPVQNASFKDIIYDLEIPKTNIRHFVSYFFLYRYNRRPFEFVTGEKAMISGFEGGILDMCEGETRHLTVPSKWAYGDNAFGQFPPRTTLYFFVTVLSFEHVANAPIKDNTFIHIDTDEDDKLSADEVSNLVLIPLLMNSLIPGW